MKKRPYKLALVTGASSGIGKELCRLIAKKGINLIINGTNKTALYSLAEELQKSVNVVVYPLDLKVKKQRTKLIQKLYDLHPDLVINCAGIGYYGEVVDLETDLQMEVVEVNIDALMEISIEAGKMMTANQIKGVIMNVSSVAGFFPFPLHSVYGATKAFVNSFSQAYDQELSSKGIRVLTSCPGQVLTKFSERASRGRYQPEDKPMKMSAEYAAQKIWNQIERKKALNTFSFSYKLIKFLLRYILPKSFYLPLLQKVMEKRVNKD